MYVAMDEGCVCSVWLGFGHIHQEFFIPLVDLVSDILVNKLLRTKSGAQVRSTL